jgi:heat shock protein HslJ
MEILFGVTNPAERQPNDPIMYIIPVNAYREMWDEAGNSSVSERIDMIELYSFALPAPAPTSGMPALPPESIGGSVNDLAVQLDRAVPQDVVNETNATQIGYRFVGRWVQDANPVTNQGLRYVYQGFTNDGQYLVSFLYPVSTAALPDDVSGVPPEEMEQFNSDPQAYMTTEAEQLNALATSDWDPDLATLDALVASLQITDMPIAGIQDETWVWTTLQTTAAGVEAVPVANPSLYQVTYRLDGTIDIVADCNMATLPYALTSSGMSGSMLVQPGPMTLAECGPDSLYNAFINNISAAQNYRVRAGGDTAELILSGGSGVMFMARLDEFSENVTLPAPEAGEPTATATAPLGVNVRTGPGSEYPVWGVASFGQTGLVVGVSQDHEWWVIDVPGAPDDQGWVSAEYMAVENAENVPVIPAPPVDQPASPTSTAPAPTPTTAASSGIIFEASTTTIDAGESATLSWSVENIQEVYMYPVGGDFTDYPVSGQGNREVQPGITTSYELLVFITDDTTSSERIEISVDDGLTSGQWTLGSMSSPSIGMAIPLPNTELTAIFESNGDLSGSAGCNTYSGGFTVYDEVLIIGSPLTTGLLACNTPPGIMEQEQIFLSLMQTANTFQISGGQLNGFDSSGNQILNFTGG